jgi:hypothetical protein
MSPDLSPRKKPRSETAEIASSPVVKKESLVASAPKRSASVALDIQSIEEGATVSNKKRRIEDDSSLRVKLEKVLVFICLRSQVN